MRTAPKPAAPATVHDSIAGLQRGAGNRAVAGLLSQRAVQRKVGWDKATTAGRGWNVEERQEGKIRRIPLEGLPVGLQDTTAKRKWVWDDKEAKKGHWETESTEIKALSSESAAKGRAIVLVPQALDATQEIEVVVFLHGHTEGTHRPFAGWRALATPRVEKPKTLLERLRQGLDEKDVAPVRDVALDQAPQQLEESGKTQTVIVLPQGGLHSQFGTAGDFNFDAATYVDKVVERLLTEKRWWDSQKNPVDKAPTVRRVTMAGHSGAGATLANMANKGSALTGDLVLYDAINGPNELAAFKNWALARLNEALAVITSGKKDAEKHDYLRTAQKLRGYHTKDYKRLYDKLDQAIQGWFTTNSSKLGGFEAELRANFVIKPVGLEHEELMRGSAAGTARAKGSGMILDALKGLSRP